MSSHLWWYVARAGGLVAWALVVASCTWGLLHALRAFGRRPSPAWMLSTHRYLSALAIAFVAVHVVAILADSYVHFSIADVLVPLSSSWHPVAVAWGIVGMYVLVAVEVTSLVRSRLPLAVWRRFHYLSFAVFALATVHVGVGGAVQIGIIGNGLAVERRSAP